MFPSSMTLSSLVFSVQTQPAGDLSAMAVDADAQLSEDALAALERLLQNHTQLISIFLEDDGMFGLLFMPFLYVVIQSRGMLDPTCCPCDGSVFCVHVTVVYFVTRQRPLREGLVKP